MPLIITTNFLCFKMAIIFMRNYIAAVSSVFGPILLHNRMDSKMSRQINGDTPRKLCVLFSGFCFPFCGFKTLL